MESGGALLNRCSFPHPLPPPTCSLTRPSQLLRWSVRLILSSRHKQISVRTWPFPHSTLVRGFLQLKHPCTISVTRKGLKFWFAPPTVLHNAFHNVHIERSRYDLTVSLVNPNPSLLSCQLPLDEILEIFHVWMPYLHLTCPK